MTTDPVILAQKLISFPSITPVDAGAIDYLIEELSKIGFSCQKLIFDDVVNLYARYGDKSPNFCFAGHTDVVPVGDLASWSFPPFGGEIHNGKLYGRGAVDMKGAIACFMAAATDFIASNNFKGSISLLITGDEEGPAKNGTVKVLKYLQDNNEQITSCIVGEPTCDKEFGDIIKIGRRGSICCDLVVTGVQGHVAYPMLADNPITHLIAMLNLLKTTKIDDGNESFQASNLEVTNIEVGNMATNVIPEVARASFNIRFNNLYNLETIEKWIRNLCDLVVGAKYELIVKSTCEAFLTKDLKLQELVGGAITGIVPRFTTDGGTSDARFIKDYCPVVEFGLKNATAHKVDEHVEIADLMSLKQVYLNILRSYFL